MDVDTLLMSLLSEHRATCDAAENKYECPTIGEVARARAEVRSMQAKLDKIGGLLDYWGNSGEPDMCGKLFRAVEETLTSS